MTQESRATTLPLHDEASTGGGCGCGCGCETNKSESTTDSTATTNTIEENTVTESNTQTFQVNGMTCGHCASAVTEELKQIPGVTDVNVDLVAGGASTVQVTSDQPLDDAAVSSALDEAGDYTLA